VFSVRRLAKLLASSGKAPSGVRSPSIGSLEPDNNGNRVPFSRTPIVVQQRGIDRGCIVRVDGLGLVVRPKRPVGGPCAPIIGSRLP